MTSDDNTECPEIECPDWEEFTFQQIEYAASEPATMSVECPECGLVITSMHDNCAYWTIRSYYGTSIEGIRINDHACLIHVGSTRMQMTERTHVMKASFYRERGVPDRTEPIVEITGLISTFAPMSMERPAGEIHIEVAEHYLDTDEKQALAEWVTDTMTSQQSHRIGRFLRLLYATAGTVWWRSGWYGGALHVHIDDGNVDSDADPEYVPRYEPDDEMPDALNDAELQRRLTEDAIATWNDMSVPERRVAYARWTHTPLPTIDDMRRFYEDEITDH